MKILHTSDWHLGRLLHGKSLIEDQKYFLNWLIKYLNEEKHDVLIISGDIYDRSVPPSEAVKLLSQFLTDLKNDVGINIFIIPGNHDSAERLSFCSDILETNNIIIKSDESSVVKPYVIEQNSQKYAFYGIPFLFDTMGHSEDSTIKDFIDNIKDELDSEAVNICAAHTFIAGSMTSESERSYAGGLTQIDSSLFSIFDYTALGHLHKGQKVGENIYYCGSPLKYSFSESEDEKHLLSIEIDKNKFEMKHVPIPSLIDMKRLSDLFINLINTSKYEKYRDYYIEVELEDEVLVENPIAVLRNIYPNILSVKQKSSSFHNDDNLGIKPDEKRTIEQEFGLFYKYVQDEDIPSDVKKEFIKSVKEVQNEAS